MHAAISYYFTQIINREETCMHNTCMGKYGNFTPCFSKVSKTKRNKKALVNEIRLWTERKVV